MMEADKKETEMGVINDLNISECIEEVETDNQQSENNEENIDDILKKIDNLFEDAIEKEKLKQDETNSDEDAEILKKQENIEDAIDSVNEHIIKNANDNVLINTLSPEIEKNEDLKRTHKSYLLKKVTHFLVFQFIFIVVLILTMVISIIVFHALGNDYSDKLVNMLFAFFGTYITSVIVELICILHFIVENVFDSSISELMKIFGSSKEEIAEKMKKNKETDKRAA